MVMEGDDLERGRLGVLEPFLRCGELAAPDPSGLVAPGPYGVEPDHVQAL